MEIPQALLVGNGINRTFGDNSWDELLKELKTNKRVSMADKEIKEMPFPLLAMLLTGGTIDDFDNDQAKIFYGKEDISEKISLLQKILEIPVKDILTTNYGYELERAADARIKHHGSNLKANHTKAVDRSEPKYMLHTYYSCTFENQEKRIWHIHGEAKKKGSLILDHYQYGKLLGKYQEYFEKQKNKQFLRQEAGEPPILDSWPDLFVMGDVYVFGFGFDFSEFDMWWLLNRKKREKAKTGKIYFYTTDPGSVRCCLMDTFKGLVEIETLDCQGKPGDYCKFYEDAITDISNKVLEKRAVNHV